MSLNDLESLVQFTDRVRGQGYVAIKRSIEDIEQYVDEDASSQENVTITFYDVPDDATRYRTIERFDAAGNLLWSRYEEGLAFYGWDISTAMMMSDGGVVIAGTPAEPVEINGEAQAAGRRATGVVARLDGNGEYLWARTVSPDWTAHPVDLRISRQGNILLEGRWGSSYSGPDRETTGIEFADGTYFELQQVERYNGYMGWYPSSWMALYDMNGNFLLGDVTEEGPRSGYGFSDDGTVPLAEAFDERGLLYYDIDGTVEEINHDFPLQLYQREAPDLLQYWDLYRTDRRTVLEFSNGDLLIYGRGPDNMALTGKTIFDATFYLAIIDAAGNLQKGAVFDDMIRGKIFIENDMIYVDALRNDLGTIDLGPFLNDFSVGAGGGATMAMRPAKGPFSGLVENNGWRNSAHFGWTYELGNGWWHLHELNRAIYLAPGAALAKFWYYDNAGAEWRFTRFDTFPQSWSPGANSWIDGR